MHNVRGSDLACKFFVAVSCANQLEAFVFFSLVYIHLIVSILFVYFDDEDFSKRTFILVIDMEEQKFRFRRNQ